MGNIRSLGRLSRRAVVCATGTFLVVAFAATPAFASAPDAPPQPAISASSTGNVGSIVVTYSAPANNGGVQISSYTATCTSSDGGTLGTGSFNTPDGSASPITVTPVSAGNNYTCTVDATNTDGTSAESTPSANALVASAPDRPAAPSLTRGSGTLIAAFSAPAANGSAILTYSVGCSSSNGGPPASNSGSASPVTVSVASSGDGKLYTCHIHATNGVGASADSLESSPAVVLAETPGAPAAPTVSSGNALLNVSFTPGAANGDTVTSNTAACSSGNGGTPGSNSGASSPITVTGLTNGASYTCAVTSTNGLGAGSASPASSSIVVGLPAQPPTPSVTVGDQTFNVAFGAFDPGGSALTQVTAVCLSSNGGPVASGSGLTSPIAVSVAASGISKAYTCHVTPQNAFGTGPDSPASASVTAAAPPDAPPTPTITPGAGLITVAFTPPASNGSPISSYVATCTSSDGGASGQDSGSDSPITVTGLTNGNTYTCDVYATNAAGSGVISDESVSAVPGAAPATPDKPTVVGGPARIVVSFDLPADNGSTIFEGTATCTSTNGGATGTKANQPTDAGESISPITVTGLTNGKTYTCKVTVTNAAGTSAASTASASVVPRTPPGAPTGVHAASGVATGASGPVNVSFVAGSANGSPITSYRAACKDLSNGLTYSKSGTHSPLQVTGLTAGHTFSCAAVDISAGGTSAVSTAVRVVEGAPGQPTVTHTAERNHALTITLLAPSANGKPITRYVAQCTSSNGGTKRGSASTVSQIVVTNLSFGAVYTCSVTANNSRGAGPPTTVGPFAITR